MSDKVKELADRVAANPDHPLRAWADHAFNMPVNRTEEIGEIHRAFIEGEPPFTRLRTDEVQERLTAEEGE